MSDERDGVVKVAPAFEGGYLVRGGHRRMRRLPTYEAALDEAYDRLQFCQSGKHRVLQRGRPGGGTEYLVIGPDGATVKSLSSLYLAENAARRLNRESRQVERPCMCCGNAFRSEGKHNRLCDRCRQGDDFWGGA